MQRGKAEGTDHVPAGFWKVTCCIASPACRWATTVCNTIREHAKVTSSWREASVTALVHKLPPHHHCIGYAMRCHEHRTPERSEGLRDLRSPESMVQAGLVAVFHEAASSFAQRRPLRKPYTKAPKRTPADAACTEDTTSTP